MNFLRKYSIGFKIITLSAVLAAIFLGSSLGYAILEVRHELTKSSLRTLEADVRGETKAIEVIVEKIQQTSLTLKDAPPIQGIIRAKKNNGYDAADDSSLSQWERRLEVLFTSEILTTQPLYDQIRYIDEDGDELVRVNSSADGVYVVPESELQNKQDRPYFTETKKLAQGDIYLSNAELNREGTPPEISIPHRGVIRYATPIYDEIDNEFRGIFIANILTDSLFSKDILIDDGDGSNTYLVKSDGSFIVHPDPEKEWGGISDLDTSISIHTELPMLWEEMAGQSSGSLVFNDQLVAYERVYPNELGSGHEWILIETVPTPVVFGPINSITRDALLLGFGTFVLLFFVFLFVIRRLLHPLDELYASTQKIGKGDFSTRVPVVSNDEIGRVAESFNTMTNQLEELYSSLEAKVMARTRELSQANELFELATSAANIGIWELDVKTYKFSWSDEVYHMLGLDPSMAVTLDTFLSFLSKEQAEEAAHNIKNGIVQAEKTGEPFTLAENNYDMNVNGKEVYILTNGRVEIGPDKKPTRVIGVVRDLSERKVIEKVKNDFISIASHQLRTPLTGIRWVVEKLLKEKAVSEKGVEYLHDIDIASTKLTKLIDSLLSASRIESGTVGITPQSVEVVQFVKSIFDEFKPLCDAKNITPSFFANPDTITAITDHAALRNIAQSLISNAIEYTPKDGSVSVTLTANMKSFTLKVEDTGIGIPKEEQDKLFTKFMRASNAQKAKPDGTGLGLYIVKQAVGILDGTISLKSAGNKGTTFTVKLPLESKERRGEKGFA